MFRLIDCIEAVAFDLDGTLIDTAPDLAAAANIMLTILGSRPVPEHRTPALIGGGIDEFVSGVLKESGAIGIADRALASTSAALFRELYAQRLFERGALYPGVIWTVRMLKSAAIPVCCVTNKESRFALPLLQAAGLRESLHAVLCADRPEQRKPSPALLLAACERVGVEPEHLLYVGDSPADVAAARAAGCRVVSVDYGYSHHLELAEAQPDAIVSSLFEIASVGLGQVQRVRTVSVLS